MKKRIFYWSPCLNPVGTVKSTLNSAIALAKYNKNFEVTIIDVCGEWAPYQSLFEKNLIKVKKLSINYIKFLPKVGYFKSRFSFLIIYIISFFPLLWLLKKEQPNKIILHLITSLPLTLLSIFKFETNFILRISGYPKLNLLRKFFWKKISSKLEYITCPTKALQKELLDRNIFYEKKLIYLPDAIINIAHFLKTANLEIDQKILFENKKIILSAGRLTKQKNFEYLIDEFFKFSIECDDFILVILGNGELENSLKKKINAHKLGNKIFLLGNKNNVYSYMKKSEIFVLSSLWEEVGFVIVEAALSNLFVISSNCPNGPSEFLNNGKNGILFKNNVKDELYLSFKKYQYLNESQKKQAKLLLKKNSTNFTKFRHYKKLLEII